MAAVKVQARTTAGCKTRRRGGEVMVSLPDKERPKQAAEPALQETKRGLAAQVSRGVGFFLFGRRRRRRRRRCCCYEASLGQRQEAHHTEATTL
jgi:hypothetical protein